MEFLTTGIQRHLNSWEDFHCCDFDGKTLFEMACLESLELMCKCDKARAKLLMRECSCENAHARTLV